MNKRQKKKHSRKVNKKYFTKNLQEYIYDFLSANKKVPYTNEGADLLKNHIRKFLVSYFQPPYIVSVEKSDSSDRQNRIAPMITIEVPRSFLKMEDYE